MVRRTITLPDSLDARVRKVAAESESFSGAVARLLETALAGETESNSWIGSGNSRDPELALRVEEVLAELAATGDDTD